MDTVTYQLIFDARTAGFLSWWALLLAPIFFFAGLALLLFFKRGVRNSERSRGIGWTFVIGAPAWLAIVIASSYSHWAHLRGALDNRHYVLVEGQVTNFVPEHSWGHEPETFQVAGHHYSYRSAVGTGAYNGTSAFPDPIHEGVRVRIADVDGQIARLEVASADLSH